MKIATLKIMEYHGIFPEYHILDTNFNTIAHATHTQKKPLSIPELLHILHLCKICLENSSPILIMPCHSCQPLLGVNHSPEFVNLYFTYAGWGLLFFRWYQQHFEFQSARVAMEGRSNVVLNMHAQLQISLLMRFLSLLH